MKKIILLFSLLSISSLTAEDEVIGIRDVWEDYRLGVIINYKFLNYELAKDSTDEMSSDSSINGLGYEILLNYSRRFTSWFSIGLETGTSFTSTLDEESEGGPCSGIAVPLRGILIIDRGGAYLDIYGGINSSYLSGEGIQDFSFAWEGGWKLAYGSLTIDIGYLTPITETAKLARPSGFSAGVGFEFNLK